MASAPTSRMRRRRGQMAEPDIPPLENGDHLDQKTFHERYEAMPEGFKAELIGGIVYVASPLKPRHGRPHAGLMAWLGNYESATPGTDVVDNTTTVLGEESEPQPDASLLILPNSGGQTREDKRGFLTGPPEWLGEIASTTESLDLHGKKADYEKAGVKEYMVAALRQEKVFWWILRRSKFRPLLPGHDGIFRSETFPGLWLDPDALLNLDSARLLAVLQLGLATPEHAAFVARLAAAQKSKS
ncbi:MAG TPA: Uma2 family endonuclease [Gemmataceae bacterium]|nr:Uma2 family endonuclease [Gemmataceae bacterium]